MMAPSGTEVMLSTPSATGAGAAGAGSAFAAFSLRARGCTSRISEGCELAVAGVAADLVGFTEAGDPGWVTSGAASRLRWLKEIASAETTNKAATTIPAHFHWANNFAGRRAGSALRTTVVGGLTGGLAAVASGRIDCVIGGAGGMELVIAGVGLGAGGEVLGMGAGLAAAGPAATETGAIDLVIGATG